MIYTFGVELANVEREMRAWGSLASYGDDVDQWISDAADHVATLLVRVGYDPEEVDGRASTDGLRAKCARIVAIRASADAILSLAPTDTDQMTKYLGKARGIEEQILNQPRSVSPDTWDEDTQEGGTRYKLKPATAASSWSKSSKM